MEDRPVQEGPGPEAPVDLDEIDSDTLKQLAQSQIDEAEARKREAELEKLRIQEQTEQAKRSIEAQREDNDSERKHQNRIHKRNSRYGIGIIGAILAFLGFLVWQGHANMTYEIIKLIVYGGVGFAAGNQYGKGVASQNDQS